MTVFQVSDVASKCVNNSNWNELQYVGTLCLRTNRHSCVHNVNNEFENITIRTAKLSIDQPLFELFYHGS